MISKVLLLSVFLVTLTSCWNQTSENLEILETSASGKTYIAETKECPLIDYSCDEWETTFIDEVGCGCEVE